MSLDGADVGEARHEQPRHRRQHGRGVEGRAEQVARLGEDREAQARLLGLVDQLLHAHAGDDEPLVDAASLLGQLEAALHLARLLGGVADLDEEVPRTALVLVLARRPDAEREDARAALGVDVLELGGAVGLPRDVDTVEQRAPGVAGSSGRPPRTSGPSATTPGERARGTTRWRSGRGGSAPP